MIVYNINGTQFKIKSHYVILQTNKKWTECKIYYILDNSIYMNLVQKRNQQRNICLRFMWNIFTRYCVFSSNETQLLSIYLMLELLIIKMYNLP